MYKYLYKNTKINAFLRTPSAIISPDNLIVFIELVRVKVLEKVLNLSIRVRISEGNTL